MDTPFVQRSASKSINYRELKVRKRSIVQRCTTLDNKKCQLSGCQLYIPAQGLLYNEITGVFPFTTWDYNGDNLK